MSHGVQESLEALPGTRCRGGPRCCCHTRCGKCERVTSMDANDEGCSRHVCGSVCMYCLCICKPVCVCECTEALWSIPCVVGVCVCICVYLSVYVCRRVCVWPRSVPARGASGRLVSQSWAFLVEATASRPEEEGWKRTSSSLPPAGLRVTSGPAGCSCSGSHTRHSFTWRHTHTGTHAHPHTHKHTNRKLALTVLCQNDFVFQNDSVFCWQSRSSQSPATMTFGLKQEHICGRTLQ